MSVIEKNVLIAAPIERVWAALTVPASIRNWMGDDESIQVDLKPGGQYHFFGSETTGKFTHIDAPNVLEYTWRQMEWLPDWADSVVRWELQTSGTKTRLHLLHSNFPNDQERDSHDEGWDSYFLEPMQEWLESED
jgi:uncharacterized protein YndB with AHSA1/START domain